MFTLVPTSLRFANTTPVIPYSSESSRRLTLRGQPAKRLGKVKLFFLPLIHELLHLRSSVLDTQRLFQTRVCYTRDLQANGLLIELTGGSQSASTLGAATSSRSPRPPSFRQCAKTVTRTLGWRMDAQCMLSKQKSTSQGNTLRLLVFSSRDGTVPEREVGNPARLTTKTYGRPKIVNLSNVE